MKNYVKKFKGYDVPKGATHYGAGSSSYVEGFYRADCGDVEFAPAETLVWMEDGNPLFLPDCAIELPPIPDIDWSKQPSPDAVWIVDNKQEVMATWHTLSACGKQYVDKNGQYWTKAAEERERITVYLREDCVKAPKRHIHADLMIEYANDPSIEIEYMIGGDGIWYPATPPEWFEGLNYRKKKPPETQSKLDREAFVQAAMKSHINTGLFTPSEGLRALLEEMFADGFRPPEE